MLGDAGKNGFGSRGDRTSGRERFKIRCSFDALVEAYGDYIEANAPSIDVTLFKDVLFNAMDGNALYEIEHASEQLRNDHRERAYYARHNSSAAE